MSTSSLTRVIRRQEGLSFAEGHLHGSKSVINMYRHMDSNPGFHGLLLARFLRDVEHNGMECLAASLVAEFKREPKSIYLYPITDDIDNTYMEYVYTIYVKPDEEHYISIWARWGENPNSVVKGEVVFVGTPQMLLDKFVINPLKKPLS